mmetsp:Transcript_23142/g.47160  ORF Transcript_23142/g.47160 Transcript_23142/m.47160 type:complete len:204 (+) Transcript_23142:2-613(+)
MTDLAQVLGGGELSSAARPPSKMGDSDGYGSRDDRALQRSASEPLRSTPVKLLPIRRKAAEIVALGQLVAQSTSGNLHREHLKRLTRHLEEAEHLAVAATGQASSPGKRSKEWTRDRLTTGKVLHQQQPPPQAEKKWTLRRGTWYYEGGPPEEKLTADEALQQFKESEERRGRGPRYENGVAIPGAMKHWQRRTPIGGFWTET